MKNDKSFIVRLPKPLFDEFNQLLRDRSINRSELMRKWIRKYVEDNRD